MPAFVRFVSLGFLALLGGCAASGDYPSLAQRPAERIQGSFTPNTAAEAPPAPVPPSPDLLARVAQLRSTARSAHDAFTRAAPGAERTARSAGSTGSDSWASAQVALADLDSLRSQAAVPLGDLDTLWVDATVNGTPRDAIGEARDAVAAMVAEEDRTLARLRAMVGS